MEIQLPQFKEKSNLWRDRHANLSNRGSEDPLPFGKLWFNMPKLTTLQFYYYQYFKKSEGLIADVTFLMHTLAL